jgi:hypothetical protein
MNNSISRLQTPLQALYLRRLSSRFDRPEPLAANPMAGGIQPRAMRGQTHFAREVLNRAGIALIEGAYRPDVAARQADVGCANPIAGAGGAGSAVTLNIDGSQTTSITAGEMDSVLYTADGTFEITVTAPAGIVGRRQIIFPDTYPHNIANINP